ncbi:MAG: DUF4340 domain-containing protein [Bdellovibrio sp.]|nr:DUF4340 domain-containing protein [Bdellovibrio sp.]
MTKLNWTKPLILAVVLIVISSVAYWLVNTHKPEHEQKEEDAKKVVKIKDTQLESIKVVVAEKQFVFKCLDLQNKANKLCKPSDQSKWELVEPLKTNGDSANVNSFLSSLQYLSSQSTIDLSTESEEKRKSLLKEYKLDKETRQGHQAKYVETKAAGGETQIIYFGETHPMGDAIFTLTNNDEKKVYLVPTYFKNNFDHDLTYWRDKKLFSLSNSEIQKFELKSDKSHIIGERKDGQWALTSLEKGKSEELPGDPDQVDSLLNGITFLNAKQFISEKKDDAKSKDALKGVPLIATFTLTGTKEGEKEKKTTPTVVSIAVYEKTKKETSLKTEAIYTAVSNLDPLFELDTSAKGKFEKTLKDLRLTKLITNMERYQIKNIEVTGSVLGDKKISLHQKEAKCKALSELKELNKEIDNDKVNSLLDKLSSTKIKDFLKSTEIPTGAHEGINLSFGDEKTQGKRKFLFWKKDDKLYARDLISKRQEAFLVENTLKDTLPWKIDFFLKQKVEQDKKNAPQNSLPKSGKIN